VLRGAQAELWDSSRWLQESWTKCSTCLALCGWWCMPFPICSGWQILVFWYIFCGRPDYSIMFCLIFSDICMPHLWHI
jgi:hypothetical protein